MSRLLPQIYLVPVAKVPLLVLPLSKGELEGVKRGDNHCLCLTSPSPSLERRGVFRDKHYLTTVLCVRL